jgi:Glycosyltransferase family 87
MRPEQNKRKLLVVTLTIPLMVLNITTFFVGLQMGTRGFVDFRHLYTAGYMVRTGHRHQIYESDPNREFQDSIVSYGNGLTLTFNHLAYEVLLFVPLSLLRYKLAYFVFLSMNVLLLVFSFHFLRMRFGELHMPRWFPITVYLAFLPAVFALDEGQDSIILFTLMAGVALLVDRGEEFKAGVLLGLSLLKFQFALPVALLYLLWRRWPLVRGFACSGAAMFAISVWMIGVSGFSRYLHSLLSSSVGLSSGLETRLGIHPSAMTNLRGLFYGMLNGRTSPFLLQIILGVASVAVLAWAATRPSSFSLAITAAVLVSYHCFADDALLLLIPLSVWIGEFLRGIANNWKAALTAVLIAAPTILLHAGERYYLMVIPILGLLFLLARPTNRAVTAMSVP